MLTVLGMEIVLQQMLTVLGMKLIFLWGCSDFLYVAGNRYVLLTIFNFLIRKAAFLS